MNSRLLVSIAVPVAAFSLTIAFSLWQRHSAEPTLSAVRPELPQEAPVEHVNAARSLPRTEDQKPSEPQVANPVHPPLPNAADADPSHTDVPVKLVARPRLGESGLVAVLLNMTTEDLAVTITAVSAKTHMSSAADVTLHAHERHNLAADGLELTAGDRVTLQSPPFRDVVVTAQ